MPTNSIIQETYIQHFVLFQDVRIFISIKSIVSFQLQFEEALPCNKGFYFYILYKSSSNFSRTQK